MKIWTPKASRAPEPTPEPEPEPIPEPEPESEPEMPRPKLFPLPKAAPKPEPKAETAEELLERLKATRGVGVLPCVLAWVLLAVAAAVTALRCNPAWGVSALLPETLGALLPPAIFAAHVLLALPALLRGVKTLPRRFSAQTLLLLTTLVVAACGIAGSGELWAAGSLLLTVSLQRERQLVTAKCRALHVALAADAPQAALRNEYGVGRGNGSAQKLAEDLEASRETATDIASPLLAALTLVIAAVLSSRAGRDFLWAWSVLLLGAFPLGALFAGARSFARLSAKLAKVGAAVGGRKAALHLGGDTGVIVTDGDLFPRSSVSLHGLKVLDEHTPDQLLGYAAALLEQAEAGSAKPFLDEVESQRARRWQTDQFRVYDAGGLGGEIGGDVVLLGSREFLHAMHIPAPDEGKQQHTLYIAVNGRAAGVFVLIYEPADSVRNGLTALLRSRARLILATRDVLLTPAMLEEKYGVPVARTEQTIRRERDEMLACTDGEQGAVLAKNGFLPFAKAVAGARRFVSAARGATAASLFGAAMGLMLTALLTLTGAEEAASAWNLLLYQLLWCVPAWLLTWNI
ncbi:MAG: hypothetical protein IJT18_06730 [Oscillospiraceae bacterium]|nr:hypothetical protein [Oscillospiraceae bacterium]